MKRILFIALGFLLTQNVNGQKLKEVLDESKLGFKIGLGVSSNRVNADPGPLAVDKDGSTIKLILGPIIDWNLRDNYYLGSGLLFASKAATISVQAPEGRKSEEYTIQYLQIPTTLKLFTNELDLDTRAYFQFGTMLEFKIKEKPEDNSNIYLEKFKPFDLSLVLGAGLERVLDGNTAVFVGISYNRGLINIVSDDNVGQGLSIKNNLVSFDLGVKF